MGSALTFGISFNLGLWENCFWCLCIWLRFLFVPDVLIISDNLDSVWSDAVSGIPKAREITISSLTSKRIHGLPKWYHIKVSDIRCSCYPGIFEENVQIFESGKLMLKKHRVYYYYYINHLQSISRSMGMVILPSTQKATPLGNCSKKEGEKNTSHT